MTTTQYIGARYVPLFASPLDWDSTKAYDALTIVYYAGNSYTSRQAVPVGIQITNEDYWALTGNYNAQIEQYRAEVKAYDERITTADTTANNALSLAQTNEKDIATLDSEMAGTAESGLKTLISTSVATETSRAEIKESELSASISAEQTRAENKESELSASISAEQTRAENKESELNTAITNEVTRATNLENTLQSEVNTNAEAISTLNAKFPITSENISDGSITSTKLASSAISALLENITIRHFDSTDSNADNTGLVCPSYIKLAGFFIEKLNILILNVVEKNTGTNWPSSGSVVQLPSYVPATTGVVQLATYGQLEYDSSSNFSTWTGLRVNGRVLYPNSGIDSSKSSALPGNIVICLTPFVAGSSATSYASYESANGVI